MTTSSSSDASLPAVSVIVPAYRQADFISRCLDSIAAQRYEGPLEVIVIDDGSPDDSAEIAASHPLSPRVIRQQNAGVSHARNAGIEASTGTYIAFLDADDTWHPDKLARQIDALLAAPDPVALSFTRYRRVDEHGIAHAHGADHPALSLTPSFRKLTRHNFIGTSTVIAHRDCFARCGHFPANRDLLRAGQDFALWLRIALRFPLVYLPEIMTFYTVHQHNRVGTDPLKHHAGGVYALRALYAWDASAAQRAAHASLRQLVAFRSIKLCVELIKRREHVSQETWRRLLPTLRELWQITSSEAK